MITGRQIKAARALLGWDAADLAHKAGLSRETVGNIENSLVQAREVSMNLIVRVFNQNRVEFIENQGVRFKSGDIEIYEGPGRFDDFTSYLHEYLENYGGEVCISAVDERLHRKYRKDPELHRRRMSELVARGDVHVRILATESKFASPGAQMRWQPSQSEAPISFYAFGDNLALISFAHDPAPYVVLHRSGPFAEAYRHAFDFAWAGAKEPLPDKSARTSGNVKK